MEEHIKAISGAATLEGVSGTGGLDGADEDDEWSGVSADEESGAPAVRPIDHEDEYIDEDKFTTVTVEEVGISREGFDKSGDADSGTDNESEGDTSRTLDAGRTPAKPGGGRTAVGKGKFEVRKKKKKKFRYESKADRKVTRAKERAKGSKAAKARRKT